MVNNCFGAFYYYYCDILSVYLFAIEYIRIEYTVVHSQISFTEGILKEVRDERCELEVQDIRWKCKWDIDFSLILNYKGRS